MANSSTKGILVIPLAQRAISIGFLLDFTWEHNAWDLPTYQVVRDIIIPATAESQKPYIDLIDPSLHGQVKVFVSHAWSNPFGLLVATARKFISDSKFNNNDCFFWLDIFAITQHGGLFQAEELVQLEDTVIAAHSTLVVIDPSSGIPLKRIWCIFEIFITIEQGTYGKLQVRAGDVSRGDSSKFLPCKDGEVLRRLADSVDVESADATLACDRDRILARIGGMVSGDRIGISEVNRKLRRAVRQGWS